MNTVKFLAAAALSVVMGGNSFAQQAHKKPNIIFILADDLGWGELNCYGNTFNETPNLTALAHQGMMFTQAYAAAPICSPTRASLMTGQYPARVHLTDFLPAKTDRYLDPAKYVTVNEALKTGGYHTGIIGKWHLDTDYKNPKGSPKQHGFDEVIASETKYIADGDYFYPYDKIGTITDGTPNEYLTDRQGLEAKKFIERNKANPFYLYLAFYSVHTRLDAPQSIVDKYKKKFDAKYGTSGMADKIYEINAKHEGQHVDNPYLAAMIERIDANVGLVMQTLKENGLDDNTILIFYSDNGSPARLGNNGGLRMGKSWLYEGGIREDFIIRWPGKVKANTKSDLPVCTIDMYPTFLEAAGIKKPAGTQLDGVSLVPYLTKGIKPSRDTFYWHYPSETGHWTERMATAMRSGDDKLLYFYKDDRYELYNLKTDPDETHDLAKEMPQKVEELKKKMDAWKKDVNAEQPDIHAQANNKKKGKGKGKAGDSDEH